MKDAAFQAYKGLYEHGLLTEHLLPVEIEQGINDDFEERKEKFHHLGSPVNAWTPSMDGHGKNSLFRTSIAIRNLGTGWKGEGIALWTFKDLSCVDNIPLFAEKGHKLIVECQQSIERSIDSQDMLNTLALCTRFMSLAARSNISFNQKDKFAVFITPDLTLPELDTFAQRGFDDMSAEEFFGQPRVETPGLVINTFEGNSLNVFHGWHEYVDDSQCTKFEVECSPFPKRRNFLKARHTHFESEHDDMDDEDEEMDDWNFFLDSEGCLVKRQPIEYAWTMRFLPSILYHMEMILIGERLQKEGLAQITFRGLPELVQAITSPSTMLLDNYERLEFLGDSLLKYHTTHQLYHQFPHWHEEHLTRQRNTIVSNISLAEAAEKKGLDKFILRDAFIGKHWKVPTLKADENDTRNERHLPMKVLADVVESLIGAAFLAGGMGNARRCMSLLLPEVREQVNFIEESTESSTPLATSNRLIDHATKIVGYSFRSNRVLLEALTHPSCGRATDCEPYQRLEFLGDAVLDYLVVTELFDKLPQSSQSQMTKLKSALVNGDFLAFLCFSCNEVYETVTYKENAGELRNRNVERQPRGLWMLMRHESEAVADARHQSFQRFERAQERIKNIFQSHRNYPWEELHMLRAPKFISDIVESVLGAIYIDAKGDLRPCRAFLEKIGLMGYLNGIIDRRMNVTHPQATLNRLLKGKEKVLVWGGHAEAPEGVTLSIRVDRADGRELASVSGCLSKEEANLRATNAACKYLEGEFGLDKPKYKANLSNSREPEGYVEIVPVAEEIVRPV